MWKNFKQPNPCISRAPKEQREKVKDQNNIWRDDGQTFSKFGEKYKFTDPKSTTNSKQKK